MPQASHESAPRALSEYPFAKEEGEREAYERAAGAESTKTLILLFFPSRGRGEVDVSGRASLFRVTDHAAGHRRDDCRGRSWSGCRLTHSRLLLQSLAQRQRKASPGGHWELFAHCV